MRFIQRLESSCFPSCAFPTYAIISRAQHNYKCILIDSLIIMQYNL